MINDLFRYSEYSVKHQLLNWWATDNEENYQLIRPDGTKNYSKAAFNYKFNSDGFRGDEFTDNSDLPIMFLGCSLTEGVGLPLDEVWPLLILDKIKRLPEHKNKKIPLWNLGRAGSGIDTAARALYGYAPKLHPKYIFCFTPFYSRREFCFEDNRVVSWSPNSKNGLPFLDRIFSDDNFSSYQLFRSLMILSLTAEKHDAKIIAFTPFPNSSSEQIRKVYAQFPNIRYYELRHYDVDYARDSLHRGPLWHSMIADQLWHKVEHLFDGK